MSDPRYLPGGITDRDLDGPEECGKCGSLHVYDCCDQCLEALAAMSCECDLDYQCDAHAAAQELHNRRVVDRARAEAPRTEAEADPDVRF